MKLLKEWKEESGYSYRKMGGMVGVSGSHIHRVMVDEKGFSPEIEQKAKEIMRLEHLIRCNPADVLLLKHELRLFIDGN